MDCGTEKAGKDLLLKMGNIPAFKSRKIIQTMIIKAQTAGVAGNDITVEVVDSAAGGLAVSTTVSAVEIDLGGDTVTSADAIAAIEADAPTAALISAKCFGNKTQAIVIQAATNLEDGSDAVAGFTTLGGLRSKGLTINNEAIDVTSHDSDQYKKLLDGAGIRSFALSGAGIFTNSTTLDYARRATEEGTLVEMKIIDDAANKEFHGVYKITSMERTGEYNAEQPWSLTIESSGEVVFGTAA